MSNLIQTTVVTAWTSGRRTKKNSKGWISGNACCCVHNGETQDKRGRGGIIVNPEGSISYSCFNCNFKTAYVFGYSLNLRFRKFLSWVGVSDTDIQRLTIEAMRIQQTQELLGLVVAPPEKVELDLIFKPQALPANLIKVASNNKYGPAYSKSFDYITERQININKYDFYWTDSNKLSNRVIIPFTWENKLVGYTARAIDDALPKYIQKVDPGYVFNVDKQRRDSKFVIVCEGVFDAMSIDGVAVLKADITSQQVYIIEGLDREIIVVPDKNSTGMNLIDIALIRGWYVSFPVWFETCIDINEAIQKYGKLFVLKDILDNVERSTLKIELKKKTLLRTIHG